MIYLDNAATSWPKPKQVAEQMQEVLTSTGGNPGRGGHAVALQASRMIFRVREDLAEFFGADDPTCVIFAPNTTQALNQALFGYLNPGDHVITSSIEHNAVSRPLWVLAQRGVQVTHIPVLTEKEFPWQDYEKAFNKKTKLVVTLHASNVTGTILPIERIGKIARAKGVLYLLDAAQTAGLFPLDFGRMPIDMLAFPGHKGLLGPQGTGGLIVRPQIALRPLIYGGTGSLSESDQQPDFLPDALESGTLNGVGIAGLGAGVRYLKTYGIDNVRKREQALCQRLILGLTKISGVQIYGGLDAEKKAPIVAFNIGKLDSTIVGYALDQVSGVIARAGLHCAPHAHSSLGTINQGVVRFSPSHFNTEEEIDIALAAVSQIALEMD
ncbi:MAG: aminotransferase class V-fold PLP-dependent enzyme [Desulfitobacteriaceae bacterium]